MRLVELIILGPLGPIAAVIIGWYLDSRRSARRPPRKKRRRKRRSPG